MSRSYYMQHMLLQYGRQLTTARRLARHNQAMKLLLGDAPPPSPEIKRQAMVERVTAEVVENLFMTGSDNPVVQDVREKLNTTLGETFSFRYPPGELDMLIFRETTDGPVEISPKEKQYVLDALWAVAKETVSQTML